MFPGDVAPTGLNDLVMAIATEMPRRRRWQQRPPGTETGGWGERTREPGLDTDDGSRVRSPHQRGQSTTPEDCSVPSRHHDLHWLAGRALLVFLVHGHDLDRERRAHGLFLGDEIRLPVGAEISEAFFHAHDLAEIHIVVSVRSRVVERGPADCHASGHRAPALISRYPHASNRRTFAPQTILRDRGAQRGLLSPAARNPHVGTAAMLVVMRHPDDSSPRWAHPMTRLPHPSASPPTPGARDPDMRRTWTYRHNFHANRRRRLCHHHFGTRRGHNHGFADHHGTTRMFMNHAACQQHGAECRQTVNSTMRHFHSERLDAITSPEVSKERRGTGCPWPRSGNG